MQQYRKTVKSTAHHHPKRHRFEPLTYIFVTRTLPVKALTQITQISWYLLDTVLIVDCEKKKAV